MTEMKTLTIGQGAQSKTYEIVDGSSRQRLSVLEDGFDEIDRRVESIEDVSDIAIAYEYGTNNKAIYWNGGDEASSNISRIVDYVDVSECDKIVYSRRRNTNSDSNVGMAWYDEDKVCLVGAGVRDVVGVDENEYFLYEVAVPAGAKYARFTAFNDTATYGDFVLKRITKLNETVRAVPGKAEVNGAYTAYPFRQLVSNGNFESTDGWIGITGGYITLTASNNIMSVTCAKGSSRTWPLRHRKDIDLSVGHTYYVSAIVTNTHTAQHNYSVGFYENGTIVTQTIPAGATKRVSGYVSPTATDAYLYAPLVNSFTASAGDGIADVQNVMCIDMTNMFGANIPTVEEFEKVFSAPYMEYTSETITVHVPLANIAFGATQGLPAVVEQHLADMEQADILRVTHGSSSKVENYYSDYRFMFISDIHGASNKMERLKDFVNFYDDEYFDFVLNAGDTVRLTSEDSIAFYNNAISAMTVPTLTAIGNHDAYDGTQHKMDDQTVVYDLFTAKVKEICPDIVQPENAETLGLNYYYYDKSGIRLIVLDGSYMDEDQKQWFEDTLADARTNSMPVLACIHEPFAEQYRVLADTGWNYDAVSIGTIHAADIELAEIVQDFMDAGGTFICWLIGHNHSDECDLLPEYGNQLEVMVGTFGSNTKRLMKSEDQGNGKFDIFTYVVVDTYNKLIRFLRMGANMDTAGRIHNTLCWDYQNKVIKQDADYKRVSDSVDTLESGKVNIQQDVADAGKILGIGADGKVTPVTGGSGGGDITDVQVNGTSVVSDGVANVPVAVVNGSHGVVKVGQTSTGLQISANGNLTIAAAGDNEINTRNSWNNPIVPAKLDSAVKAAMCDGVGAAWTDAEKAAARNRIGVSGGGGGASYTTQTLTITAGSWAGKTCTKSVTGVTASNLVQITPASSTDADKWFLCGVFCSAQASGTLTFTCNSTPTADIGLKVIVWS